MPDHLPDFIDPVSFADKSRTVVGELDFSRLDKLSDLVVDNSGRVRFELRFGKSGRIAGATGTLDAVMNLQCQRCLGELPWHVHAGINVGFVKSVDEASLLPENMEPVMMDAEGHVSLVDVVQDEMLLAIPVVPRHENCGSGVAAAKPKPEPDRPNPFAVLNQFKNNTSSKE
jgi:uncharacterized protein